MYVDAIILVLGMVMTTPSPLPLRILLYIVHRGPFYASDSVFGRIYK